MIYYAEYKIDDTRSIRLIEADTPHEALELAAWLEVALSDLTGVQWEFHGLWNDTPDHFKYDTRSIGELEASARRLKS